MDISDSNLQKKGCIIMNYGKIHVDYDALSFAQKQPDYLFSLFSYKGFLNFALPRNNC